MNWDDLRFVLALSRARGLSSAARALGVNTSSVYRRLEALESGMGARLFERLRSGYRLTGAGEELVEAASRMESEALVVERRVLGADERLQGSMRLATSEALMIHVLADHVEEFRARYPDVHLDVALSNRQVDLARRDADVVIRATSAAPDHLVGRSIGHVNAAAYASAGYLDARGRGRPIVEYDWIGYSGALAEHRQARWTSDNVPDGCVKLRFDSIDAVLAVVARGVGCGALPCFIADGHPALERLPGTYQETDVQLWVLTHPDLRKSARIRAGLQFFGSRLSACRSKLLGRKEGGAEARARRALDVPKERSGRLEKLCDASTT
jgi:DNA-binding transcriptional LysR family regulator